jgi:hypothetical protein
MRREDGYVICDMVGMCTCIYERLFYLNDGKGKYVSVLHGKQIRVSSISSTDYCSFWRFFALFWIISIPFVLFFARVGVREMSI